jgi:hypothetical protein
VLHLEDRLRQQLAHGRLRDPELGEEGSAGGLVAQQAQQVQRNLRGNQLTAVLAEVLQE